MKILFKNKTKYTKDCYQQYLHFHQSKYGLRYQFTTIVVILMLSFCILMNLNYKNYIALILLLPFLCTFIYHQFYHPKKIDNAMIEPTPEIEKIQQVEPEKIQKYIKELEALNSSLGSIESKTFEREEEEYSNAVDIKSRNTIMKNILKELE